MHNVPKQNINNFIKKVQYNNFDKLTYLCNNNNRLNIIIVLMKFELWELIYFPDIFLGHRNTVDNILVVNFYFCDFSI